MPPSVSVIVPNYNHARFLPERLKSIADQAFTDYELIALDDCSTDNSREVLTEYSGSFPLRLAFNEKNSGSPFIQWQKGATMAHGKYLWIAESDDFADPELLSSLVAVLEHDSRIGLAYCQSRRINAGGVLGAIAEEGNQPLQPGRWLADFRNNGRDELARYLVIQNTIPNASAVVVRRSVFLQAVAGAENRRLSGDWWTWARMLLASDIAYVARPLNYFRTHDRSVRDTTTPKLATAERLSLQAYISSEASPSFGARRSSFNASYGSWRHHVRGRHFARDWHWLRATVRDACRVYPLASFRMAACLSCALLGVKAEQ